MLIYKEPPPKNGRVESITIKIKVQRQKAKNAIEIINEFQINSLKIAVKYNDLL